VLRNKTHTEAEQRYSKIRKTALLAAERGFDLYGMQNIKATTITPEALSASRLWATAMNRRVNWDWVTGYSLFKFRYPKRFEIALWDSSMLIGLSLGRPTFKGTGLRLDVVEGSPKELGDRPGIIEMMLLAYTVYARLIKASEIRIMNPINETVKKYYESYGYTYVAKKDYLYRKTSL